MSKLLPLLLLTILVIASIVHTTPKIERTGQITNQAALVDTCDYRTANNCLDDSEYMDYNQHNNDGITKTELTQLENFKNINQ